MFLLQAYMREHECTLTTENSVVTVKPATKECINAGNLTTRGCSDLMPSSASSNLQGPSSSRRKRGAGGQGPPSSGSSSNYKNWKAINSSALLFSDDSGTGGLGATPESVDSENLFLYYYMEMDAPDRKKIGHQLTDLIKACSFRGKDCTSSE